MGFSIGSVFKNATKVLDSTLAVANTAKKVAEVAGIKTITSESPFGKFASILVDALANQQEQANSARKEDLFPIFVGQGLCENSLKLAEDYEEQLEILRSNPDSPTDSEELSIQAMDNLVAKGKVKKEDSEKVIDKASIAIDDSSNSFEALTDNPVMTTSKVSAALINYFTSLDNIKDIFW